MGHLEDCEILEKFGSEPTKNEAFNLLLLKYQQKIYWHIRHIVINHDDADDIVQDVFISVWKNLGKFRNDAGLYTWLYRIATNASLTFLNRKKQFNSVPLGDVTCQLENTLTESSYFDGVEIEMKLQKALLVLPEKQRLVFNMRYFDDLKYDEISEILGTSIGALKASYHLAVKKIENYLIDSD